MQKEDLHDPETLESFEPNLVEDTGQTEKNLLKGCKPPLRRQLARGRVDLLARRPKIKWITVTE